ncbi:SRPBCC family protein [Streptosporangium sp. NPDC023615]|uniref:SRPBCC family protein n=1 Tax=Streptosporangium sp. NPDC023615 TaxID=3154794 RepID=UPI00341A1AF3
MTKPLRLLRLLVAPLSAALLLLTVLPAPAQAETDPLAAARWQAAWDTYRFYECLTAPLPITGRSRVERDISIDIDAPAEQVFDAYSDIENHLGIHPFLRRVLTHRDRTENGVRLVDLTAVEDVPVAGVPVSSETHAQQRLHRDELFYETDTWTLPNVVTHQRISFEDLGDGRTRVTEHLVFEASVLLIDFTVTNGVSSHRRTQAGLKEAIESGEL